MAIALTQLVAEADRVLEAARFNDYCPNGLQVEGRPNVSRIISGVTASQALVDAAIAAQADVLLVHHGYFWKGENPCITGMKQRRIKALLDNDISLLAYHLPLDVHAELGNNVQLARLLGWSIEGGLEADNPRSVGLVGAPASTQTPAELAAQLSQVLGREPLLVAGSQPIRRLAWCTGAAQSYIDKALAAGVDAFITGEISEPTVHIARENDLTFIAAGHHATERYGVQALGEYLARHFAIEHQFIDCANPV
ncbi:Nif3-like dinuclear metal center hexameric protein [Atopomonas sediminilitoris]|uniref:Nif3-like dinuclear metal center hexameric protein n=1 Tax=Atopomonas sediminilitoris TaxID=2919919 RepID=UPI001F4DBB0D|nr:Nif3-like dinuclear metal center hexameric protein [Atopomonas sediminilitoris]MCJ8169949.1 Nif3-like dinuclear metal center hexameric protein [Atopomonas sediminilitoris]